MTREKWAPVPGWDGLYEVSTRGRVRSLERFSVDSRGRLYRVPGRVRKLSRHPSGYVLVNLCAGGSRRKYQVHRLVLAAFIGPCPEGMETRHLDGDRANNHLENLAWGTPEENTADRVRHGTTHAPRPGAGPRLPETCPRGHLLEPWNIRDRPGRRECLACRRASSTLRGRVPVSSPEFLAVANRFYEEVLESPEKRRYYARPTRPRVRSTISPATL